MHNREKEKGIGWFEPVYLCMSSDHKPKLFHCGVLDPPDGLLKSIPCSLELLCLQLPLLLHLLQPAPHTPQLLVVLVERKTRVAQLLDHEEKGMLRGLALPGLPFQSYKTISSTEGQGATLIHIHSQTLIVSVRALSFLCTS